MARPDEASRSRSAQMHRSDIPRMRRDGVLRVRRGGVLRDFVRHTGAAFLGYLWASFLVAASGTESLLARLSRRR